jgi:hypothetical protein
MARLAEITGRVKNMKLLLNEVLVAEWLIKNIVPFGFKRLN